EPSAWLAKGIAGPAGHFGAQHGADLPFAEAHIEQHLGSLYPTDSAPNVGAVGISGLPCEFRGHHLRGVGHTHHTSPTRETPTVSAARTPRISATPAANASATRAFIVSVVLAASDAMNQSTSFT